MKIEPYILFGLIYLWITDGKESEVHLIIAMSVTIVAVFATIMALIDKDVMCKDSKILNSRIVEFKTKNEQ